MVRLQKIVYEVAVGMDIVEALRWNMRYAHGIGEAKRFFFKDEVETGSKELVEVPGPGSLKWHVLHFDECFPPEQWRVRLRPG